jgi:hypothetical protein
MKVHSVGRLFTNILQEQISLGFYMDGLQRLFLDRETIREERVLSVRM